MDLARAKEPGRGRSATTPGEIPWRGWKDIFIRTYGEINDDRVLAVAAGVVFYVLLAIFPTISTFVSLYALFADPATIRQHLAVAAGVMPPDAFDLLQGEVIRIASKPPFTLGFASLFSLLFALWSANAGTKAMFDALTWPMTKRRSVASYASISRLWHSQLGQSYFFCSPPLR
jgi:membrane protein